MQHADRHHGRHRGVHPLPRNVAERERQARVTCLPRQIFEEVPSDLPRGETRTGDLQTVKDRIGGREQSQLHRSRRLQFAQNARLFDVRRETTPVQDVAHDQRRTARQKDEPGASPERRNDDDSLNGKGIPEGMPLPFRADRSPHRYRSTPPLLPRLSPRTP